MNEKKFALNMPEGTGLLTYMEKGEKARVVAAKGGREGRSGSSGSRRDASSFRPASRRSWASSRARGSTSS